MPFSVDLDSKSKWAIVCILHLGRFHETADKIAVNTCTVRTVVATRKYFSRIFPWRQNTANNATPESKIQTQGLVSKVARAYCICTYTKLIRPLIIVYNTYMYLSTGNNLESN